MGLLTNQCVHTSHWAYHYLLLHNNGDFSSSVVFDFFRPRGLQHARLLCPSLTPRTCSNSCPLSWWLNSYYVQGIILNVHRYCWYCCCLVTKLCLTLLWPQGLQPTRLLCPWDFPGKNIGMDCHFLRQRILIQVLNHVSCIAGRFFTAEPPGKPIWILKKLNPPVIYKWPLFLSWWGNWGRENLNILPKIVKKLASGP